VRLDVDFARAEWRLMTHFHGSQNYLN